MPAASERGATALAALALFAALACGCATSRPSAPAPAPDEAFRGVLGRNPGLGALRAVAEARFGYAGREVTLPGVLVLDALGGFRLELLDPLDRPVAILFAEDGRIVQYRPAQRLAASIAVVTEDCRVAGPADWVAAVLSSSQRPVAGESLRVRSLWSGELALERSSGGLLRASVRFGRDGAELTPRLVSWFCGDTIVMRLRERGWVQTGAWRLPTLLEIEYPQAGLVVSLELREIEGNPPPAGRPLAPRLGEETRWISWRLPE